jgi:SAM-dependent methyltransferase
MADRVEPDALATRLTRYYTRYYRDTLGIPEWEPLVAGRLSEQNFGGAQLARIEHSVGTLAGRTLLNVGCGTGGFNVAAERAGAHVWGIDAGEEAVAICRLRRGRDAGGRHAVAMAEALPFRDAAFDVVICLSTLEHVADVETSLREMVRVLRPGGVLFLYAPSGWACYESHYKLAWVPWSPRFLARMYLRLRGRPTGFVGSLNLLSARRCRGALEAAGARVQELDLERTDEAMRGLADAYYRILGVKPYIALAATRETL